MRTIFAACLVACLLASCALVAPPTAEIRPTVTPSHTATPTDIPATATPVPPTPTPAPVRVWFDLAVPQAVRDLTAPVLSRHATVPASSPELADLRVGPAGMVKLAQWVYTVVAPFPTFVDDVSWEDVLDFWSGKSGAMSAISEDQKTPTLFVDAGTLAALKTLLGKPNESAPIVVAPASELVEKAWAGRPHAWGILPFEALEPRWKVLSLDGASVLDKQLDVKQYPLALTVGADGSDALALAAALVKDSRLSSNRETERMTILVMTGVTAMARSIAARMEQKGILYPTEHLVSLLRSADLTHISNEIPFTTRCPPPDFNSQSMTFCSSPAYIDVLRTVGTDVIELTGNHVKDYGAQAMLDTLDMYDKEGWPYFGGGRNLEEALEPLLIERNGNSFAFIGSNPVGPNYAWATKDQPGSAPCNPQFLYDELAVLKAKVDVPIATYQYLELYQYEPSAQQRTDFRELASAGAAIVSGSQAHQPQAIEFYKGSFIHYGLGNLFFDQMWSLGTRQEMIDRHVIYMGRHVSTELYTYMLEDYSQPRPMTAKERRQLLTSIFKASGW